MLPLFFKMKMNEAQQLLIMLSRRCTVCRFVLPSNFKE